MTIRHDCAKHIVNHARAIAEKAGVRWGAQMDRIVAEAVPLGCFKSVYLPDWGVFDDCLDCGARFSDVDGILHIRGRRGDKKGADSLLFMEWKTTRSGVPPEVKRGPTMVLEALALAGHTVVLVAGDVSPMDPTHYCILKESTVVDHGGVAGPLVQWAPVTMATFKARLRAWVQEARGRHDL